MKRTKNTTQSVSLVLIICGILVVINYLSLSFFARADLTENKEYTVSQATKSRLKNLDDLVNVKVYFSKNLPSYLLNLQTRVQDILDEYKAYAKGKMKIEYIDPGENPKTEQQVQALGIPPLQLNIMEKDKTQVRKAYLGIGIFFEDKKVVIPVVQSIVNLEYDLTSAIVKVSNKEVKTIGFLAGHHERDIYEEYEPVREALEKTYQVRKIEIKDQKAVPGDISTLVIAGPQEEINDRERYHIDQYLMKGGKLILLLDPIKRQEKNAMAIPIKTNLEELLTFWGITPGRDLVLDRYNVNATFSTGFIRFSQPYPYWVKVNKGNFSREKAVVSQLESVVLPWTGYLEITSRVEGNGLKVTELAKSSTSSWIQAGNFNISPQQQFKPTADSVKSYILALALEGKFKSFYLERPIPSAELENKEKKEKQADMMSASENLIRESSETQVIILANSYFLGKDFVNQFRENATFFLNLVDWLNLGSDLIGIRSRSVTDRPLSEVSEQLKGYIKFFNIWLVPILMVLFGLVRFYLKRRQARFYQEIYSS